MIKYKAIANFNYIIISDKDNEILANHFRIKRAAT